MHIIKAKSPTDAWLQSHKYLLENGNKISELHSLTGIKKTIDWYQKKEIS